MTARRDARAGGQQPEAIVELRSQSIDTQQRHSRRCQLDRERDAIEPAADIDHDWQGAFSQHEPRSRGLRARDEQRDRADVARNVDRHVGRQGQGGEANHLFVRQAQRLLAGGQHSHRRGIAPQGGNDFGDAVEQVFAVVEDEQHPTRSQRRSEISGLRLGAQLHLKGSRHSTDGQRRIGERRQFDHPHAVGEVGPGAVRGGLGQAGLADPSGADDADQRMLLDQLAQSREVVIATVQWLQLSR